jgi:hypothetical protein
MFELFGGNILEIRAIQLRLDHFEKMFNIINEYPLLSIGAKKSLIDVGDNDYIFTIFQWGIFGAIVKYSMFMYLFFKVKRTLKFTSSESEWFVYGTLTSIFILFIAGLTGESFYNYKYLTIILINAGYCLSMYSNRIYYETNFKNRHFVPPEYELQFK